MERLIRFVLLSIFLPTIALAALPTKVDGLRSNGNVDVTGNVTSSGTLTGVSANLSAVIQLDEQASTPSTPAASKKKIYAKNDGKVYTLDSTGTETQVGAGAGSGGINYITNYDAEADTSGYANYADAAATSPVDGTAGSPTTAIARSTSSPLRGTASFEIAKSAANRQGEGVSYAFTIDAADKGQPLQISFNYEITSGTFADADIRIFVYDVTNSRLVEPDARDVKATSIKSVHSAKFQASSDSTSYRLIFHIASTSASAYTIHFDNVKVSPENTTRGAMLSDWKTIPSAAVYGLSNEAACTNSTVTKAIYRQVGDSMEVLAKVTFAGAPATCTGALSLLVPSVVVDTTKWVNSAYYDTMHVYDASTSAHYSFSVRPLNKTGGGVYLAPMLYGSAGPTTETFSATSPFTVASTDELYMHATFPVVGWSAGIDYAPDAGDGRAVVMRSTLTTLQSGVADKVIPFNSVAIDTHGILNTSTGVATIPVGGWYSIYARAIYGSMDGSTNSRIHVYKNGVEANQSYCSQLAAATTTNVCNVTETLLLAQGDTVSIFADGDASFDIDINNSRTTFSIEKVQGPAAILAGQSVVVQASTAAGQSLNSTPAAITFGTINKDSTGSWATDTFTSPVAGQYLTCASLMAGAGATLSTTQPFYTQVYKNGSLFKELGRVYGNGQATNYQAGGCVIVPLLKGETAKIYSAISAAQALYADASYNNVSIVRVGNY
jgi:hypothetical protein